MKRFAAVRSVIGWLLLAACIAVAAWLAITGVETRQGTRYAHAGHPEPPVEAIPVQRGEVPVNSADAEALTALHGIGPSLAQRIIDERELHGPYFYPEDLVHVNGIGPSTMKNFRDALDMEVPLK